MIGLGRVRLGLPWHRPMRCSGCQGHTSAWTKELENDEKWGKGSNRVKEKDLKKQTYINYVKVYISI